MLFYAESVGVVTSNHVTKMAFHTIRSAVAENPQLYANFTTLSFMELELLPIEVEVLHCGNSRKFRVFWRKIVDIIKCYCSHPQKDVAVAEAHLLSHKTRLSVKRCDRYR